MSDVPAPGRPLPVAGEFVPVETGVRLYVERAGAGPALLLVPGLGAGSWLWEACAPRLAEHFTLVMPELCGGGRSDKPDRRYSVEQFASDLVRVLDALGIERYDLLGASLGGYVAQQLAARWPERVRRLVLVGTSVGGAEQIGPSGEILVRTIRPRGRTRRERLEDAYDLGFTPWFRGTHPETLERITSWRLAYPQPEWAYYRQLLAGSAYEGAEAARRITAPTLVVVGDDDPLVPPENAAVLQRHIRHARCVTLEGRHLFLLEQGERFASLVLDFLRPEMAAPVAPMAEVAR